MYEYVCIEVVIVVEWVCGTVVFFTFSTLFLVYFFMIVFPSCKQHRSPSQCIASYRFVDKFTHIYGGPTAGNPPCERVCVCARDFRAFLLLFFFYLSEFLFLWKILLLLFMLSPHIPSVALSFLCVRPYARLFRTWVLYRQRRSAVFLGALLLLSWVVVYLFTLVDFVLFLVFIVAYYVLFLKFLILFGFYFILFFFYY